MWYYLRGRRFEGAKFVRQFPIGPHVADFACRDLHLAIEVDGGQHSAEVDAPRTQIIESFGYRVIRFWNNDVLENTEGVLEIIRREISLARNNPLPWGRGQGEGVRRLTEEARSPLTPTLSPPGRGRI